MQHLSVVSAKCLPLLYHHKVEKSQVEPSGRSPIGSVSLEISDKYTDQRGEALHQELSVHLGESVYNVVGGSSSSSLEVAVPSVSLTPAVLFFLAQGNHFRSRDSC